MSDLRVVERSAVLRVLRWTRLMSLGNLKGTCADFLEELSDSAADSSQVSRVFIGKCGGLEAETKVEEEERGLESTATGCGNEFLQ